MAKNRNLKCAWVAHRPEAVAGDAMRDMENLLGALRAENDRKSEIISSGQNLIHSLQTRGADLQAELGIRPSREAVSQLQEQVSHITADRDAWRQQAQGLVQKRTPWWRKKLA